MITYDDILNINFYKKEKFTGSFQGMRYLIEKKNLPETALEKETLSAADWAKDNTATSDSSAAGSGTSDTDSAVTTDVPSVDAFLVSLWAGPYNSVVTPDKEKTFRAFPFTEEGRHQSVDWLNEQWQTRQKEWTHS